MKAIILPKSFRLPHRGRKCTLTYTMTKYKNHRIKSLWDNITVIDTSYSGVEDILKLPVFMLITQEDMIKYQKTNSWKAITIPKGTSICQLEILPCMEEMEFNELELEEYKRNKQTTRGGFW